MGKENLVEVAKNTVNIQNKGYYDINGSTIFIQDDVKQCIKNTVIYIDDNIRIPENVENKRAKIEFTNETTIAAALRLKNEKGSACALNFASAKHPGGGFLKGSMAQEESIAYISSLYISLSKFDNEFYKYHLNNLTPFYSDRIIYSKDVLVFKDEKYNLLENPYKINIITSPAVNAGIVMEKMPDKKKEIYPAMEKRIRKIIQVAVANSDKNLVLGAFGCGVFKNDLSDVARIFKQILLKENYQKYFNTITFAIFDRSGMEVVNTFRAKFSY